MDDDGVGTGLLREPAFLFGNDDGFVGHATHKAHQDRGYHRQNQYVDCLFHLDKTLELEYAFAALAFGGGPTEERFVVGLYDAYLSHVGTLPPMGSVFVHETIQ